VRARVDPGRFSVANRQDGAGHHRHRSTEKERAMAESTETPVRGFSWGVWLVMLIALASVVWLVVSLAGYSELKTRQYERQRFVGWNDAVAAPMAPRTG
jgi:hypothetical protein